MNPMVILIEALLLVVLGTYIVWVLWGPDRWVVREIRQDGRPGHRTTVFFRRHAEKRRRWHEELDRTFNVTGSTWVVERIR